VLGFEPMTYGSESECATHYTIAPHKVWVVGPRDASRLGGTTLAKVKVATLVYTDVNTTLLRHICQH